MTRNVNKPSDRTTESTTITQANICKKPDGDRNGVPYYTDTIEFKIRKPQPENEMGGPTMVWIEDLHNDGNEYATTPPVKAIALRLQSLSRYGDEQRGGDTNFRVVEKALGVRVKDLVDESRRLLETWKKTYVKLGDEAMLMPMMFAEFVAGQ